MSHPSHGTLALLGLGKRTPMEKRWQVICWGFHWCCPALSPYSPRSKDRRCVGWNLWQLNLVAGNSAKGSRLELDDPQGPFQPKPSYHPMQVRV